MDKIFRFVATILLPAVALTVPAFVLYSKDFSIEFGPGLTPEQEVDLKLAAEIAQSQISKGLFEVFLSISAVVVAIGALLGFNAYNSLKGAVDHRIRTAVDERLALSRAKQMVVNFNEFAYVFFRMYETVLQAVLDGDEVKEEDRIRAMESADTALFNVRRGLRALDALGKKEKREALDDELVSRNHIHLLNQELYSETALRILRDDDLSKEKIDLEVLSEKAEALYCLPLKRKSRSLNWYEVHETVAFFYVHMGRAANNQAYEARGKDIVNCLLNERPPKLYLRRTPSKFKEGLKAEYTARGLLN